MCSQSRKKWSEYGLYQTTPFLDGKTKEKAGCGREKLGIGKEEHSNGND